MPAERTLHVPGGTIVPRLPVEPRLPRQSIEDPRIDVAAAVVAHVDDQAVALEDRRVLANPVADVAATHGAKMDVTDLGPARLLDPIPARHLPLVVTQSLFQTNFLLGKRFLR